VVEGVFPSADREKNDRLVMQPLAAADSISDNFFLLQAVPGEKNVTVARSSMDWISR
jgi:hypothetical protein